MNVARRKVRVPAMRHGGIEASQADAAAVYLTNEVFLYRVAGVVGSGADEVVELEDCYGLDSVKVSAVDLHARRLRVVAPARDAGARLAERLDHAAALGRTLLTERVSGPPRRRMRAAFGPLGGDGVQVR